jgi:acetolactate synthase-1/2/3 large subunit
VPVPPLPVPDPAQLAAAARRLGEARTPVIVVGGGAVGAASELTRLVERLGALTVSTVNGKGVLDEHHPLALGASIRLEPAQRVIDSADVVLCVGTELGDSDLWGGTLSPAGTVIRADIEAGQLQKNLRADIALHGAARQIATDLLTLLGARSGDSGSAEAAGARAADARREIEAAALRDGAPWREIQDELRRALPPEVVVAGDSAQVSYYGTVHFWPTAAPRRFLYPTGFAPLGYGLPAAIGAKAGQGDLPVIVLVGDGGFQLTSAELMTATQLRLNLPVIVMNNGGYGEIRREMVERGIQPLGVGIGSPDYAAFAESFGAIGHREADPERVASLAAAALRADRPTVIEVPVPAA